ncbi:transposase family protein [Amphibacillus jilinensis]|uniref:transposase family protein n=1 Tax=Amphibacillus jilinensis TaxID=1216008 RepID=UPI000302A076|nr:transposase family protein [Amphibacillus jilinensis]
MSATSFYHRIIGIKDKHVDVWDVTEESSSLIVELYTKQKQEKCPFCKEKTNRVHSYRRQEIQGPVLSNKDVKISLKKRRYLCPNCSRPFYERLQMADYYQRWTNALKTTALAYTVFHSFRSAARLVGMTTNLPFRLFDHQKLKRLSFEIAHSRGNMRDSCGKTGDRDPTAVFARRLGRSSAESEYISLCDLAKWWSEHCTTTFDREPKFMSSHIKMRNLVNFLMF